ncbi:MAG: hypothetical protein J7578_09435, partial [Chitinophagaceae bacterium]|nr:hypothetical protein [Chitinophagaceae bacterium]
MKLDLSLNACLRAGYRLLLVTGIMQPVHAQSPLATPVRALVGDLYMPTPALPFPYPDAMPVNAIRVWEAKAPEPDAARLMQRPLRDVLQTAFFFDGLGRPLQSVVKRGALSGNTAADWVS